MVAHPCATRLIIPFRLKVGKHNALSGHTEILMLFCLQERALLSTWDIFEVTGGLYRHLVLPWDRRRSATSSGTSSSRS